MKILFDIHTTIRSTNPMLIYDFEIILFDDIITRMGYQLFNYDTKVGIFLKTPLNLLLFS